MTQVLMLGSDLMLSDGGSSLLVLISYWVVVTIG